MKIVIENRINIKFRFTEGKFASQAKSELKLKTISLFDHVIELQM